jgi:DNA-binding winged helix-turn-helix (wHTH) protein
VSVNGRGEEVQERVDLAREPAFRLGRLEVTPALRQVAFDSMRETLEPRVMQVLVVLAKAGGEIVGRNELIARCWDGRVVGDNAINRVISLLRRFAAETGAFSVETVTKVGYRLVGAGAGAATFPWAARTRWPPLLSVVAIVLAALALVIAFAGGWTLGRDYGPPASLNSRVESDF